MAESRTIQLAAGERDVEAHLRSSAATAIAELIWNGLDADATVVNVRLVRDLPGGPVSVVRVEDDGHGISPAVVEAAFGVHRDSPKRRRRVSPAGRPMHGRQGRGRFRALAVASRVQWESTGDDGLGHSVRTRITINRSTATKVDIQGLPSEGTTESGTSVTLTLLQDQKTARVGDPQFREQLAAILAPTLLGAEATVYVDDSRLDPADQVEHEQEVGFEASLDAYSHMDGSPADAPVLHVIEWRSNSLTPTLFLCDENGAALAEFEGRRLPRTPSIAWTAYLRWEGFGRDTVTEGDLQNANATFADVIEPALSALSEYLQDRADALTGDVVDQWVADGSYPYTESPDTVAAAAEQTMFRELVGVARKALPENHAQRKLALGMMQAAFRESPDDAVAVIEQVRELRPEDVRELRELLEQTSLDRLVRASKTVSDRVVFLVALKELLYGADLRQAFLERDHLQRLLERNSWIFGNQWALMRSEVALLTVLREHLGTLRPELGTDDARSGARRIDMLLSGVTREHERTRRLVVELKRASNVIRRRERDQIEDYARDLANSARFAGETVLWDFWLIGTEIDDQIVDSVRQRDLPPGLYQEIDLGDGSSYRVWVKTWSEVIAAAEEAVEFFRSEMDFDPDALEAVEMLRSRFPNHVPSANVGEALG